MTDAGRWVSVSELSAIWEAQADAIVPTWAHQVTEDQLLRALERRRERRDRISLRAGAASRYDDR
jgi:hypothetical protein